MKPQDSRCHYKSRGTRGKSHHKPHPISVKGWSATALGGIWEKPVVRPAGCRQRWLCHVPFRRGGSPGSTGRGAQGPASQGTQADKARDPAFPLGQVEAGRAQESKNSPAIGHPSLPPGASRPV